jgi:hypothetical protein
MGKNIITIVLFTILLIMIMSQDVGVKDIEATIPIFEDTPSEPSVSIAETIGTKPSSSSTEPPLLIELPNFYQFTYTPNLSKEENIAYRVEINNYITILFSIMVDFDQEASNYLEVCNKVCAQIEQLQKLDKKYLEDYLNILADEEAQWAKRMEEYPVATQIWLFMKEELGWSDAVCAGVLGNMMAEAGGQTLKIQWNIWDKSGGYYGICQWAIKYVPTIANNSLEQQLLHIKNTVEKTMNGWGRKYAEGFGYSEFIALEDPKEVALAFAACYERCSKKHYQVRTVNAMKAYEYFTSDTRE